MSDQELKELGLSRAMYDQWIRIMDTLFAVGKRLLPGIRQKEDDIILLWEGWEISASVFNNEWIEVEVQRGGDTMLRMRYAGNIETILTCVFAVAKGATS